MLAKHFEFFLGTAVAVVLLTSLPGRFSAVADQQPSPVLPTPYPAAEIALVDMAAIFAMHPKFIAETTAMKADAKRIDGSLLECVQSVAKLQLELSQSEQGTPEHADLARRVTRTNAEINADRTKLVQEFKQREALVCRSSYQEIQKPIGIYAKAPGIRIVFRHGGTHHGTAPAEIIQSLQAAIVYHDGLDITAEIIKWLKAASADPQ
jgi:Skp family chaperone for outer membrane proteins